MRSIGEIVGGMMRPFTKAKHKHTRPEGRRTLPNPHWKRSSGGNRGWRIARFLAADPDPITRQVRRRNGRWVAKDSLLLSMPRGRL